MINWRGKDYPMWTDALKEQQAELERMATEVNIIREAGRALVAAYDNEDIDDITHLIEALDAAVSGGHK